MPSLLLIDTHAHLYPCYPLEHALAVAFKNLYALSERFSSSHAVTHAMIVMDPMTGGVFEYLHSRLGLGSLIFRCFDDRIEMSDGARTVILFPGQQIITKEKIEVLSLLTRTKLVNSLPLPDSINSILDVGGVPVFPWSFGKWSGDRKKLLKLFLRQYPTLLGDIPGRYHQCRVGLHLSDELSALPYIAGSDPLPEEQEYNRLGMLASAFELPDNIPITSMVVKELLTDDRRKGLPIGTKDSFLSSIARNMRWNVKIRGWMK